MKKPSPEALAAARQLNVNGLPDEHIAAVIDHHFSAIQQDRARLDFLKEHTHYEFWVHHPDYAKFGGHRFNSEGIVIREVVDSAMQWLSANHRITDTQK